MQDDLGFHEIWGHSPLHAPPPSPELKSFCWNIWIYKVLGGFHLKSARFHEICWISGEIRWISWNLPDFMVKSAGFHELWAFVWWSSIGLSTFERPNIGLTIPGNWSFEIWQISPVKSGRFHPDFTCEIHPKPYKSKCFSKNSSVWWMQGGGYDQGFHEIRMKSAGFQNYELLRDDQV